MDTLLKMTVSSSIVLLIVILLKKIFRNRISPGWHKALWLLPAARMVIPKFPESHISIENAVFTKYSQNTFQAHDYVADSSLSNMLIAVWATVTLIFLLIFTLSAVKYITRLNSLPVCSDTDISALFNKCCQSIGVAPHKFIVRTGADENMLFGITKPVICICDGFAIEELKHIFLHELNHYKSKDILIKIFAVIMICVYWFNPLVWLAFKILCRDIEQFCDYKTVKITGERKEYSLVLLKSACKMQKIYKPGTAMGLSSKEINRRIKGIASFYKPSKLMALCMAAAITLLSAFCLTDGISITDIAPDMHLSSHTTHAAQQLSENEYGEVVILDLNAIDNQ